ncbi:MAG: DUF4082 domain-containing protein [Planctomycetota bacterium]|jgi:hypothetical protein
MRLFPTLVVACGAIGVAPRAVVADGIHPIDFDESTGLDGIQNPQTVGWRFDVLEPIIVTGVTWYDEFHDGLLLGHETGLWDPAGNLLTSADIPAGTGAPLDGIWRVVKVEPFVLLPDDGYIVGGFMGFGSGDRLAVYVDQTVHPAINWVDAMFAPANGEFQRPTSISGAENGFYGPSFQFTLVPAPATAFPLLAGLLVSTRRRRRIRPSGC